MLAETVPERAAQLWPCCERGTVFAVRVCPLRRRNRFAAEYCLIASRLAPVNRGLLALPRTRYANPETPQTNNLRQTMTYK